MEAAADFSLIPAVFYMLAGLTLVGAGGVAFSTHIVYSALSMMVAFFGVSGLYVMLSADFVAGVQLLVYVGGVLVLTLFAVMLTHGIQNVEVSNRSVGRPAALAISLGVFVVALKAFLAAEWAEGELVVETGSVHGIGDALLSQYILPFEVASLVLLAVLIGAVVLTRKEVVG